jgi:hypothetical protein
MKRTREQNVNRREVGLGIKPKPFVIHGMTKHGAVSMFRFYEKNYGSKHISGPDQLSEGQWRVTMTPPEGL